MGCVIGGCAQFATEFASVFNIRRQAKHGMAVVDTFCFWMNKGSGGKTTLCFHSLTPFAEATVDKLVVVADLDLQLMHWKVWAIQILVQLPFFL